MNLKLQENELLSVIVTNGLGSVFVNDTSLSASFDLKADKSSLSAYLDKRTGGEVSASVSVSGVVSSSNDIIAHDHGLVGKDVDFSTGGLENFAVGHDHKFYGKESFAVHDGNIVGAKGFYWKAIIKVPETSSYLIYLQSAKHEYEHTHMFDSRCMPLVNMGHDSFWKSSNPAYDSPYFGLSSEMAEDNRSKLLSAETDVNIGGVIGKYVTIVNCWHEYYLRWLKVKSVLSGSVLSCEEIYHESDALNKTFYRKSSAHTYHDNQYLVYFTSDDNNEKSSQASITCNDDAYVTSTTFGATALGDANTVFGYNAFASGKDNKAIGAWSTAMGQYNRAYGQNSIALGDYAHVSASYAFAWNGISQNIGSYNVPLERKGTFNINPNGGLNGFYIGSQSLSSLIEAAVNAGKSQTAATISAALSAVGISPLSSLNAQSDISDVIDSVVAVRDMLFALRASLQG